MRFKPNKEHYLLLTIFFIVLACRLYYAFQTPYLSSGYDYYAARQVENIIDIGMPIVQDDLSYGGRVNLGSPFFYYMIAFFDLFMPLSIVGKVVCNIFASSLVIMVYLISYELIKSRTASLFSALISGFIPIYIKVTVNSLSVYSIAFPLIFLCVYCFLRIEEPGFINYYLAGIFFITMISPISLLLALGFIIYLILLKIDRMQEKRAELEVMIFSILFIVWFLFVIYKKAFVFHGTDIIWWNIPKEIMSSYFGSVSILTAIYQIGSIPLIYAVYTVLQHIYRPSDRNTCLFSSMALSAVLLLWLRLIELSMGMIYLGIISVLLFAQFYSWSFGYWKNTRFAAFTKIFFVVFLVPLILTSFLPSLSYAQSTIDGTISDDEMAVLKWIEENTDENITVLAPLSQGHLITGIAKRRNVADDNFLLISDVEKRQDDIRQAYTAMFETEALRAMDRYNVRYIMLTPEAMKEFKIDSLAYAKGSRCFSEIYSTSVKVYSVECRLKDLQKPQI